jgi:flagellar biosynthesis protein FliR
VKAYMFSLYAFITIATGFVMIAFQAIMWYYVSKFVGIPFYVWLGFMVCAFLLQIFANAAKKELKQMADAINKAEGNVDAV